MFTLTQVVFISACVWLLFTAIYHFIQFLFVKDKTYFYYSFFLFVLSFSYALVNIIKRPEEVDFEKLQILGTDVANIGWASLLMFSTYFLNGKVVFPKGDKICRNTFAIVAFISIANVLIISTFSKSLGFIINIINNVLIIASAVYCVKHFRKKKSFQEKAFFRGMSIFVLTGILSFILGLGFLSIYINANFLSNMIEIFGIAVHLFFFSAGIAKKNFEERNAKISMALQLVEAENMALRSQMNPHFIFNCLNTIDSYILTNKTYEASELLQKFSKLVRRVLETSNHATISFAMEFEMLQLYIELQKELLEHKFTYKLTIENQLNNDFIIIPSLLLQPFVENAILHGIRHLDGNIGILAIEASIKDEKIEVIIEDNGIGRKQAEVINQHRKLHKTSLGSTISEKRLLLIAKEEYELPVIAYEDMEQDGKAFGTKVFLKIPIIKNQNTIA